MPTSPKKSSKFSAKSYIGTRDFFPQEMRLQRWLFETQRSLCRSYGYEEYASPLLESMDLYRSKSSEEIVNEQVYSFTDRGRRELAIRPEMTPSLARMISSRQRELPRPVRWFSIANFMRYERPGHGRLREFFQLNVDLLGASGASGNAEILSLAADILTAYGAKTDEFQIRYNDRRLLESYLNIEENKDSLIRRISRVIDKRAKLSATEFDKLLEESFFDLGKEKERLKKRLKKFLSLSKKDMEELGRSKKIDAQALGELSELESILRNSSCKDALCFDPGLVRGFDYYTGFVFEIYDCDPKNSRSILGGGRYDGLLELLGVEPMPAVGFGLGDVTLEHFLRTHGHIPKELEASETGLFLVLMSEELKEECFLLAQELRSQGIAVEQALEPTRKLGRQFEIAQKKGRRFALILGEEELARGVVSVKNLSDGKQEKIARKNVGDYFKKYL